MKIKLKIALVYCFITLSLFFSAISVQAQPKVMSKPASFDYVQDYAGLLDTQDAERISSLGREIDEKTKAQIVVVTVDSLGEAPIEDYANTLFRSWGIGNKEQNNGVLILVNKENVLADKPGRIRIEVGYGLEGAITDGKAGRILDEYVLPRFAEQSYSQGILQGYLAVAAEVAKEYKIALDGNYTPVPGNPVNTTFPAPLVVFIIVVIIITFISKFKRRRRRNRWDDDDYGGGPFGGGWGGFGGWGGGNGGGGGFGGGGFGGGSSGGGGADR